MLETRSVPAMVFSVSVIRPDGSTEQLQHSFIAMFGGTPNPGSCHSLKCYHIKSSTVQSACFTVGLVGVGETTQNQRGAFIFLYIIFFGKLHRSSKFIHFKY